MCKKVDKCESAGRCCAVEIELLNRSHVGEAEHLCPKGFTAKPLDYPKADLTTTTAPNDKSKLKFVVCESVIVILEVFRTF